MVELAELTDVELYDRGAETVIASWSAYARGAPGGSLLRLPGVAAAVFPDEPERSVYNNALLERRLTTPERRAAVEAMEDAYRAAGVTRFAAWVHESDEAMRLDLERRGYHLDVTTRAMGISLDELHGPGSGTEPELELVPTTWLEYLEAFHLPSGLLVRADHTVFRIAVAGLDGERVSTAMAFDHEGDCGIYNVETLVRARRRGLATALTTLHLRAAVARGCRTASLQATAAARRVYASVGFRDLGAILEYVP